MRSVGTVWIAETSVKTSKFVTIRLDLSISRRHLDPPRIRNLATADAVINEMLS